MQGNIKFELYWNHAPRTCRNFADLVSSKHLGSFSYLYILSCFVLFRLNLDITMAAYFIESLK